MPSSEQRHENDATHAAPGGVHPATASPGHKTNAPYAATGGVHPATAAIELMPTRPGPTAHPALPQPELDVIEIHRLHVRGYHGVHDHERQDGQDFYIDATVWIDTRAAAASDDIADTMHYGHLMRALHEVGSGPPVDLLETLAERLAAVTLAFSGPQAVRITVHKPKAPVQLRFDDVTVSILRFRPAGEPPDGENPDAPSPVADLPAIPRGAGRHAASPHVTAAAPASAPGAAPEGPTR